MFRLSKLFDNLIARSSTRAWNIVRTAANDVLPVAEFRFKKKHIVTLLNGGKMETDPLEWLFHNAHEKITDYTAKAQIKGEAHGIEEALSELEKEIGKLPHAERSPIWRKVLDQWSATDKPLLHRARDLYETRHAEFATDSTIERWQEEAKQIGYRNRHEDGPFMLESKLKRLAAEERAITEADPHGVGRY